MRREEKVDECGFAYYRRAFRKGACVDSRGLPQLFVATMKEEASELLARPRETEEISWV